MLIRNSCYHQLLSLVFMLTTAEDVKAAGPTMLCECSGVQCPLVENEPRTHRSRFHCVIVETSRMFSLLGHFSFFDVELRQLNGVGLHTSQNTAV
jgi:hypothetical protein